MTALWLDENLSEAILGRIVATFPGSLHVRRCIANGATDDQCGTTPAPATWCS